MTVPVTDADRDLINRIHLGPLPSIEEAYEMAARHRIAALEEAERSRDFHTAVAYDCGYTAGIEAAMRALKTVQYSPSPYTSGMAAIRALIPAPQTKP